VLHYISQDESFEGGFEPIYFGYPHGHEHHVGPKRLQSFVGFDP